jgi:hypothetical protein
VHIQYNDSHDVALLQLQGILKDDEPFYLPCLTLTSQLPEVGTAVLGIGYTKMDIVRDEATEELRNVTISQACHGAHGEVTQLYPDGRDRVMLPFPVFETSARFDPGMSGGPVFSGGSLGVCGVVCSGLTGDNADGQYTSFAAYIQNAFNLSLLVADQSDETVLFSELINRGVVGVDLDLGRGDQPSAGS